MSNSTVAVANDSAISYFGLALSENICRTPEGYVICKDAVIGRTGKQQYLVSSLHIGQLKDLGLDSKYRPNEVVDVWRDPDEVFSPAALSSYEGKPITDNHPNEFVTAENWSEHSRGHVQNVRAGTKPLSTGDLPVLGDVIITDPDLGNEVLQRRRRELSGGYNYHLAYDGQRLSQVGITGNHVAVVPKGRAGAEARINDAAPRKEYPVMSKDLLIGLGLSAMARENADPDKVVAAARAAFATDTAIAGVSIIKDPALEAKDAEIEALKTQLKTATDALAAKGKDMDDDEEEKKEKAEDADLLSKLAALDEDDEEECKKKEKAEDANFIAPIGDPAPVVSIDSKRSLLRELRPLVAKSKDSALIAKFNKITAKANDAIKGTTPDNAYAEVHAAAGKTSAAANDAMADYSARLNARAEARSRGEEVK